MEIVRTLNVRTLNVSIHPPFRRDASLRAELKQSSITLSKNRTGWVGGTI
jgi:hypothetical protein